MGKPAFSRTVYIFTISFLFLPLLVLVFYSFNEGRGMLWQGFSLKWYVELFTDSRALWRAFGNSMIIALTSSLIATVLGSLAALGLVWYHFRFKRVIQAMSFMPLILPEIIIGVSNLAFFAMIGLPLGMFSIFVAHVSLSLPFVLLMVQARLEEFDFSIIEAAKDLGANERQTLFRVLIPIASPGIIAGFLTAFTLSLEDFVVSFFVSGPGSTTLPIYLFSAIKRTVPPEIKPLSVVLILGTVLLAMSARRFTKYLVQK